MTDNVISLYKEIDEPEFGDGDGGGEDFSGPISDELPNQLEYWCEKIEEYTGKGQSWRIAQALEAVDECDLDSLCKIRDDAMSDATKARIDCNFARIFLGLMATGLIGVVSAALYFSA